MRFEAYHDATTGTIYFENTIPNDGSAASRHRLATLCTLLMGRSPESFQIDQGQLPHISGDKLESAGLTPCTEDTLLAAMAKLTPVSEVHQLSTPGILLVRRNMIMTPWDRQATRKVRGVLTLTWATDRAPIEYALQKDWSFFVVVAPGTDRDQLAANLNDVLTFQK